jgi:hypothetical protein
MSGSLQKITMTKKIPVIGEQNNGHDAPARAASRDGYKSC